MIRIAYKFFSFIGYVLGLMILVAGCFVWPASSADAATCTISSNTLIDQSYVDSNSCSSIDIQGNVSTTWVGTVDLQGAGTVTVKTNYTMTLGATSTMVLGSDDDLVIETTATATHVQGDVSGIQITAHSITVNGAIDASSKGCSGGTGGGNGYGPNTSSGYCGIGVSGYGAGGGSGGNGGQGAAHAGIGGSGPTASGTQLTTYGSSLAPTFLGSGGGGGYYADGLFGIGGTGGGRIRLIVSGTLTVSGRIWAKGGTGLSGGPTYGAGGGGAGGSIYITAGTLAGSGSISADGGSAQTTGNRKAGGGSGGRVAVFYDTLTTFTLTNITAVKGTRGGATNSLDGGVGTTYILNRTTDDGVGTLTITSGFDFNASGDYVRDAITIASGAVLGCSTITTQTISSAAWLSFDTVTWNCSKSIYTLNITSSAGISTTSTVFNFWNVSSSVIITAPRWTNVTTTFNMLSGASSTWDIASDLTLSSMTYVGGTAGTLGEKGGWLSIKNAIALTMTSSSLLTSVSSTMLTSLTIDSRSTIDATGKGCQAGIQAENGYGPNTTTGICATATSGYGKAGNNGGGGGGGAAHAGTGGNGTSGGAAQSTTYGSSTSPVLPGSGGGGGYFGGGAPGGAAGGAGGGVIRIIASGALSVGGAIKANGAPGTYGGAYNGGAGGSGGSIYLRAGSISGSASITANGGAGASTGGGGGGGGRIAIIYSGLTYSGTSSTSLGAGGTSAGSGTAGSIYTYQANQLPNAPSSLGQTALVNGATTSTGAPIFTFTLSDSDVSDTVKYRIQIDDSADFGSPVVDYTSALAAQGSIAFQVGQTAGSGTYTVGSSGQTLSSASYYWRVKTIDQNTGESSYATANSGSVAFIVDSTSRLLSFQMSTSSGLESLTSTSIRILLNVSHFEAVTVDYAVTAASSTATGEGVDYTLTSGTATITAGQTSTTIPLTIVNDSIDEPDETVTITLSNPQYAVIGSNTSTIYTITDNDEAGVTMTESSGSTAVTEGGASDSYTLVLTSQPTSTVSIALSVAGSDISVSTSTIDFTSSNWDTPVTVTVSAINDSVDEPIETDVVAHIMSVPTGFAYGYSSGITIASVTTTVTDDDVAGVTVAESGGSTAVTEGGIGDTYTLVLTSQPTSTVLIAVSVSGSQAEVSTSTVAFTSSNWNTPVSVTVTANDDHIDEPLETQIITQALSVPTGYAYGYSEGLSIDTVTTTVTDDDTAGVALIESAGSTSVTEGGSTDAYTLALTSEPTSTVRINVSVVGSDISVSTSTIEFTSTNWNTPVTVTVAAINDQIDEPTETDRIDHALSLPSGFAYGYSAGISIDSVTTTVIDNDAAGVTIDPASALLSEGGTSSTYTVVLDTQPTSTVQVILTGSSDITIDATTLSFTSVNWNIPQTVTVNAFQDTALEGTQSAEIAHATNIPSGSAYGYGSLSIDPFVASIADDDTASIAVAPQSLRLVEGGDGAAYSVVLGSAPTATVQILISPASGLSVSTRTLSFTSSNWSVPQDVTVSATDDDRFLGEARSLSITQAVSTTIAGYALLTPATIAVTVIDDESSGGGATGASGAAGAIASFIPLPMTSPTPPPVIILPMTQLSTQPIPSIMPSTQPSSLIISNPDALQEVVNRFNQGVRNEQKETLMQTLFLQDLKTFGINGPERQVQQRIITFLTYGLSRESARLGSGERRAILRDYLETTRLSPAALAKAAPTVDMERIANGLPPLGRNIIEERRQIQRALPTFQTVYGHAPNFQNAEENLAWNTLLYRVRFPRDLAKEKEGIQSFKATFGKAPSDPFQWSVVRVMGYVKS